MHDQTNSTGDNMLDFPDPIEVEAQKVPSDLTEIGVLVVGLRNQSLSDDALDKAA